MGNSITKETTTYAFFMYKVNTEMHTDLFPPLVSEVSDYPLRNNRTIVVTYDQTSISQNLVFRHPSDYGTL